MKTEQLFDTLLEPTFVIDQDQVVLYCNEPAALICELTARKIIRQKMKLSDILTFSEPIEALGNLTQLSDPSPYKEVKFKSQSGTDGKIQVTVQPFNSELAEKCWVVFIRDVTLEERLQKKYRAELEQKEDFILQLEQANRKLEDYSRNLEKMVEERTSEIKELNHLMRALLDSLDQGFFIFNDQGICLDVYSQACLKTLENSPKQREVWSVLGLTKHQVDGFKKWMMTAFEEMLPFEDLAPLGPQFYPHSQGRKIQLAYYPLRNTSTSKIEGIVVVSSDITDLVQAQREAEVEKSTAKMIVNLVQKKNEIMRFIQESQMLIAKTHEVLDQKGQVSEKDHDLLFRNLHTLKGGAATYSLLDMTEAAHETENLLSQGYNHFKNYRTQFIEGFKKVQATFSDFMQKAQEILGEKAFAKDRVVEVSEEDLQKAILTLESHQRTQYFGEYLEEKYLQSDLLELLSPYEYLAQQTAQALGKKVQPLFFEGFKQSLDCRPLQNLCSTLVHAYKNAIDHGLESPEERTKNQKPPEGKITTLLQVTNEEICLTISDDGQGIDPQKIRQKLDKRGYNHSQEDDHQVIQHVFDPQFSTKENITEISGRGVGMDAIKAAAQDLGGTVAVTSTLGKGTNLKIKIPKRSLKSSQKKKAA